MRQLRKTISLVLALLLLMGLSATAMATQVYQRVDLAAGTGGTGASSCPETVTLSVKVGGDDSSLTIYKIADAEYDNNSGTVVVSWQTAPGDPAGAPSFEAAVGGGQNWIAELTTPGWLLQNYPSPNALGAASAATQKSVLTSVAKYIDTSTANYGTSHQTAVNAALNADSESKIIKFTSTDKNDGTFTFTDLPIGLYLAFDGSDYTPYTINAVPQKLDNGNWGLPNNQFVKKFSGASLVKTISQDQVAVGDEVEFSITAGIPNYPKTGMAEDKKIFTIDDDMSTAFAYNPGTMKIQWIPGEGSSEPVDIPEAFEGQALYTPVISSDVTVYSCPTSSHQYFNIYEVIEDSTYYYYFMKDDVLHLLYETTNKTSRTLNYSGEVFKAYQALTGDRIGHGLSPLNVDKNLFNVNFDYSVLAAWMVKNKLSGGSVKITYNATVTESAKVNADTNYNTAILRYAKDEKGTVERLDDTVRAYTYGVNIVKVNGDSLDANGRTSAMTEYLAGAVFSLYKQHSDTVYKVELDDLGQAVKNDSITDDDSYNEALNAIMAQNQVPYALPNVVDNTDTTEDTTDTKVDGYILYGKIKNDIRSVANATGVQINGLGPGTYLLIEDLAPSGYNLLTQGIRFTIEDKDLGTVSNAMTEDADDEISEEYGKRGSLTALDTGTAIFKTGYLDLLVSNFRGLTLPETGGEGTVMFTAFGLLMMTTAMYVLVMKKRRMA